MILHTNVADGIVYKALRAAYESGKIADAVQVAYGYEVRGSRTHEYAIHFQLEYTGPKVKGDGRRPRNSGTHGAAYDSLSATWDEHGHVMAQIFQLDRDARFGGAARPIYDGRDDFHAKTGYAYHPNAPYGVAYGVIDKPGYPVRSLTVDRDMAQLNVNLAFAGSWPDARGAVVPLTRDGSVSAYANTLATFRPTNADSKYAAR